MASTPHLSQLFFILAALASHLQQNLPALGIFLADCAIATQVAVHIRLVQAGLRAASSVWQHATLRVLRPVLMPLPQLFEF